MALETFLVNHNAIAVCHASSQWHGSKRIFSSLICSQGISSNPKYAALSPDLIIQIGEMSNDYSKGYFANRAPVWRVSEAGDLADTFGRLEKTFDMPEYVFFAHYADGEGGDAYYRLWREAYDSLYAKIPELPFSNLWIGKRLMSSMPKTAILHIGLSSTLQNWATLLGKVENETFSNVGTCGIDGPVSTMMGASFCNPDKLFFAAVGDLSFFYDMNSLGNRHVGPNFRLMVDNNGTGGVFHTPNHPVSGMGDAVNQYIAATGHFGAKSHDLLRHYAIDLGYKYICASSKEEFEKALPEFVFEKSDRPIVFECFTEVMDDAKAWGLRKSIDNFVAPQSFVGEVRGMVPQKMKNIIKAIVQ